MKLEEIRKLCDEPTPGPWKWLYSSQGLFASPGYVLHQGNLGKGGIVLEGSGSENNYGVICSAKDREFIAASRNLMPKLLAIAEAVQVYRAEHADCYCCTDEGECSPCFERLAALDMSLTVLEGE